MAPAFWLCAAMWAGARLEAQAQIPPASPALVGCVHFQMYEPEQFIGQERGGLIAIIHEDDGTVDLNYMTGRQPGETDNPPDFWEHKIRVPHDNARRAPRTYHHCEEH